MFSILNHALSWAITSFGNEFCLKKRSRLIKALDNRFYVKFIQLEIGLNLLLKRDNKELKDRLIILERVLDQVLRDQEEKRSLKLENREEFKWRKVQYQHKPSERKQFSLEKSNSFDILSDLEETVNSETESTSNGASVSDYKRRRTGPRVRSKKENSQISRQRKQLKSNSSRKAHVKRTEESMYEKIAVRFSLLVILNYTTLRKPFVW